MTPKEKLILRKLFEAEINCRLPFQFGRSTQPHNVLVLETLGLVCRMKRILPGHFPITLEGWCLTTAGHLAYCQSCDSAKDPDE